MASRNSKPRSQRAFRELEIANRNDRQRPVHYRLVDADDALPDIDDTNNIVVFGRFRKRNFRPKLVARAIRLHNAAHIMRTVIAVSLVALFAGCAYSHVASTGSTFQQPTTGGPLELRIARHLDTIVPGPDDEEDQSLSSKCGTFDSTKD